MQPVLKKWWIGIKAERLPEYVIYIPSGCIYIEGHVYRVKKWYMRMPGYEKESPIWGPYFCVFVGDNKGVDINDVYPSNTKQLKHQIERLHSEKEKLLDTFGLFGGGADAGKSHQEINTELELYGYTVND